MLTHYSARTSGYKIEQALHDIYDGETPVWAVEVFGPPEAMAYDKHEDTYMGPWVLGTRDEVEEYLELCEWDYEVQYTIEHDGEPYDA